MPDTAIRRATYQDILDLPDGVVGEIIHGVLHTQPRPRARHAMASSRMGVKLGGPFDSDGDDSGPGGWIILDEPELHFEETVLVPDLAGWRRERMPEVPDVAYFDLAPDWVCEVLSPSTAQKDRVLKSDIYAAQGVSFMWLVDPDARTLEAFTLTEARQWLQIAALAEDAEVAVDPFAAAPFKLSALWA